MVSFQRTVNTGTTLHRIQGEYTGGQAKAWIYPSSMLQPITAKYIKQQPII